MRRPAPAALPEGVTHKAGLRALVQRRENSMTLKQSVLALAQLCTDIADGHVSRRDLAPVLDPIVTEMRELFGGFVDTPRGARPGGEARCRALLAR